MAGTIGYIILIVAIVALVFFAVWRSAPVLPVEKVSVFGEVHAWTGEDRAAVNYAYK